MPDLISLIDIANYDIDIEANLGLYFSRSNPEYTRCFVAYSPAEVNSELAERMSETDKRSALVALARIEAAFRKDYIERCRLKKSDNISIAFRKIHRDRGRRARLDEDILDIWYQNVEPSSRKVISSLRGMLRFRHWLAHGRYWDIGAKYTFQDIYFLAEVVLTDLPLCD
jgi:hypothetical protein